MFISKNEKEILHSAIKSLASMVQDINTEVIYLRALIKADKAEKTSADKKVRDRTAEQKVRQAEYMRNWHAKRRQEKKDTAASMALKHE